MAPTDPNLRSLIVKLAPERVDARTVARYLAGGRVRPEQELRILRALREVRELRAAAAETARVP